MPSKKWQGSICLRRPGKYCRDISMKTEQLLDVGIVSLYFTECSKKLQLLPHLVALMKCYQLLHAL